MKPFAVMLSAEDYKLIEEAARRDNMTVEEWAEATLIKDAQKRMKNYYDDESSLPNDIPLAAEIRRSTALPGLPPLPVPHSPNLLLPAASRGNNPWRIWQARPVQGTPPSR